MRYASLQEEKKLWAKGYRGVVCLDEVGRGPIAGPVVAAGVMINYIKFKKLKLEKEFKDLKLLDSKNLSAKKRLELYKILTKHRALKWGIGKVSEKIIDRVNILEASKLAMLKAVKDLQKKNPKTKIDFLILDGTEQLVGSTPQKAIVRGDEQVFSCAAASIIAKVSRDRLMVRYHKQYPGYDFNLHKGYATARHRANLKKHGPCKIHRKSFAPVKACIS